MWDAQDEKWMHYALSLARSSLGKTAPNPSVGCVIASGSVLVAQGATGPAGRPHAEERALEQAFASQSDRLGPLSLYVTLEPCSRRSNAHAMSCASLIAASPIAYVFVACLDPFFGSPEDANSWHDRQSIALMETSGKQVRIGLCAPEAYALNKGFFTRLETGRPILVEISATGNESPDRFDAEFTLERGETVDTALERLGKAGMTRVFVRAGSPVADAARRAGLLAPL